MARASLKPLNLPKGVSLTQTEQGYSVKGPNGTVQVKLIPGIAVKTEGSEINLSYSLKPENKAMLGLAVALLSNAFKGVTEGFRKVLTLRGIGYKVSLEGRKLTMNLGYTHPIVYQLPEGIEIEIFEPRSRDDKGWIADIIVKGIDKQLVGQVAANIRRYRPPEPYKGKGIRYKDEYVRRKLGKRAVGVE
ncbi:50S ribosomal protein L6 [candidate division WOR-3 bacterium]|uniref:Large ribosomal subunit protein uL6 n=1 Tax=candidate division WOR-3 bacterium TaxID=2052148 RepID=A0A9D5K7Q1_UNCW3|nr:50S ribosomal protein L6 [candidate division WOR-3 bacterium]MBD3363797.1 50S ribosomal protein L6 [candidate division WOR-3 bacterium]